MAYNNAWANHRLLAACGRLGQGELVAARTSFFPSIHATLNHIVTVDWLYIDAMERAVAGREPNPNPGEFFTPENPFETCADLSAAQRDADRRLVAVCAGIADDAALDTPVRIVRRSGVQSDSLTRIMAHLFQHQIHHRGQVHAMLAGTSVAPPQLDEFFCSNEAHLRAADLAELGYSEQLIWE